MLEARPCEQEWSAEKAQGVRRLIEDLTGKPAPCERGLICPLLPEVHRAMLRRTGGVVRSAPLVMVGLYLAERFSRVAA